VEILQGRVKSNYSTTDEFNEIILDVSKNNFSHRRQRFANRYCRVDK